MDRSNGTVVLLIVVGALALVTAGALLSARVQRPDASGELGELVVFAQLPTGPARLRPERQHRLPRPQHFAFRFTAAGTGPRLLRIEVKSASLRYTAYEQFHEAPAEREALDFVLLLDESTPDRVELLITLEAPHTQSVTSRFPVLLTGPSRRFWED